MPIPHFSSLREDLARIGAALRAAAKLLQDYVPGMVAFADKGDAGPVTEADIAVNELLRRVLLRRGEGWLSGRPWTTRIASGDAGCGLSTPSMGRGSSSRAFPNGASPSG
jgi:hypothetical protein